MKINNEFTVHAPIDRAWAMLTDVEAIAPCMPGAQLTGLRPAGPEAVEAVYEGKVKVRLGPVVAEYQGTAVFIEKDGEKYHGVIDAKGRDSRGAGNAAALITVQLRAEDEGTTVRIDTDLKISGKIAQFGAGMIQEVSQKLLGQFVDCLENKLTAPVEPAVEPAVGAAVEPALAEPPAGEPEPVPTNRARISANPPAGTPATTVAAGAGRRTFQTSLESEALDLLDLAGPAAMKRLLPMVIAAAVVVAAVIFFLIRR